MELQELKATWKAYDQQLAQNLQFNELILRRMHLDRSKKEMRTPLQHEVFSSTILFGAMVFYMTSMYNYGQDRMLFFSGIGGLFFLGLWLSLSLLKIQTMFRVNYFDHSILSVQKALVRVKKTYLLSKKIELGTAPLFFFVSFPILIKALRNLDFMENPKMFFTFVVLGSVLSAFSLVAGYWWLYDQKLKNASQYLIELEQFADEKSDELELL